MTGPSLVLALDTGTQSSRALLFDAAGRVVASGQRAHAPLLTAPGGAVEQDLEDVRGALVGAMADCAAAWRTAHPQSSGPPPAVAAALTTQRGTFIPVDADGMALAPCVSWLDRRDCPIGALDPWWVRVLPRLLGSRHFVPRLVARSTPRRWRAEAPPWLGRMARIVPLEAWLHQALTGRLAVAPGGVAGVWPFDAKTRGFARGGLLYPLLGFDPDQVPEVVEAGAQVGTLSEAVATETGMPPGLPLFAVGGDKQAEVLGAGVRPERPGVAAVSLGTASSITLPWARPLTSSKYTWITTAGPEADAWCLEYMVFRGMWTAAWFARQLAADLAEPAAARGLPVEALLAEEAAAVPPGSEGLITWPRWSPSIGDPTETGTVIGIREVHTRGHLFRSLIEGIAMDLCNGRQILERASGRPITRVCVGGGGARSPVVVQILAAALDLPVERPHSHELSGRGAALVAAVAGGLHPTMAEAVSAMVPPGDVVAPDPELVAVYDRLRRDVLAKLPRRLRPVNRALLRGG